MKFKIFLALFLFILCLPLLSDGYLIQFKFSELKLFLINDVGIIIAAYPVAAHESILNYLPLRGNVASIEKNLCYQIIIKFETTDINLLFRIYGTENNVLLNRKSTRGCVVMQNKDILSLVGFIGDKQTKVLFEK